MRYPCADGCGAVVTSADAVCLECAASPEASASTPPTPASEHFRFCATDACQTVIDAVFTHCRRCRTRPAGVIVHKLTPWDRRAIAALRTFTTGERERALARCNKVTLPDHWRPTASTIIDRDGSRTTTATSGANRDAWRYALAPTERTAEVIPISSRAARTTPVTA